MPRGVRNIVTKKDLVERKFAFLAEIDARIKQYDRREKSVADLKKWLANRKLDFADLSWMMRQMKPVRADKPVKSKKPLRPGAPTAHKGSLPHKGDLEFAHAIRASRKGKGWTTDQLGAKLGVSGSAVGNWEGNRNMPTEEKRVKLVKILELPENMGAEAVKRSIAREQIVRTQPRNRSTNGTAANT